MWRPQTKQARCERTAVHTVEVATEHFPELPGAAITEETPTRIQHSAGTPIHDRQTEENLIRLSRDAYETYG